MLIRIRKYSLFASASNPQMIDFIGSKCDSEFTFLAQASYAVGIPCASY